LSSTFKYTVTVVITVLALAATWLSIPLVSLENGYGQWWFWLLSILVSASLLASVYPELAEVGLENPEGESFQAVIKVFFIKVLSVLGSLMYILLFIWYFIPVIFMTFPDAYAAPTLWGINTGISLIVIVFFVPFFRMAWSVISLLPELEKEWNRGRVSDPS
jgi:hypothetical protein